MKKNNPQFYNKILFILFIICIGLFTVSLLAKQSPAPYIPAVTPPPHSAVNTPAQSEKAKLNSSFNLVIGEKSRTINFNTGQTLYEILLANNEKESLGVEGKMYDGIGFFITSIGGLHEGNGQYIMYDINDKEASVGVSVYTPQNNDKIIFKLKKSW